MATTFHILNGDALKAQFPESIKGTQLVARECLVDGPVKAKDLKELFRKRALFISEFYGDYTAEEYMTDSAKEFELIQAIPNGSEINLWFEDDLFCQVNFWFICHLICQNLKDVKVSLIRPKAHNAYGFGGLNQQELLETFENKIVLEEIEQIALLWTAYQNDLLEILKALGQSLQGNYPFIIGAIEAHIERIPTRDNPGRPINSLLEIMNELETREFVPVFREFNKRESIYGFGDLQVKRLYDKIIQE